MRKKVCLITTNHIATNPRLVKEGMALEQEGYGVHIVFSQSDQFLLQLDRAILATHPAWTYSVLNRRQKSAKAVLHRTFWGFIHQASRLLAFLFRHPAFARYALNKNFHWQVNQAVAAKASLYIAHNLGALPVAQAASAKLQVPFGFDAEDFHRHEISDHLGDVDVLVKSWVEDRYLHQASHLTAASPLIAATYQRLYPSINPVVVLNVFPRVEFKRREAASTGPVRLFWFSQAIGPDRGIETILEAIGQCKKGGFELHLLGRPLKGYKAQLHYLAEKLHLGDNVIHFHDFVPEKEIFARALQYDIGMASETGVPYNRDICLTNKIFTYIQSGLAVVASDTAAQGALFGQYPSIGKLYQRNSVASLAAVLDYYAQHREELRRCKCENFQLGQSVLNWETEHRLFLASVRKIMGGVPVDMACRHKQQSGAG